MAQTTDKRVNQVEQLQNILETIFGGDGEGSVWDDSSLETAERVIRAWYEFAPRIEMGSHLTAFESPAAEQLVAVRDIQFSSLCAHHLFPWTGVAHVGYMPHKKIIGISKIPRLVQFYAMRPSTQERTAKQVADALKQATDAKGVAVVMTAVHTCMSCRGVKAQGASMVTSHMSGIFLTAPAARAEFIALIGDTK